MKRYTFKLVITEGSDEFWESLHDKSGCDEVTNMVKDALFTVGIDPDYEHSNDTLELAKYEDTDANV